ncbi:hypothetical protein ACTVJH_06115 [Desulfoplanes sp. PS50]
MAEEGKRLNGDRRQSTSVIPNLIRDDGDYHKPGSKIGSFFSEPDIPLAFLCATASLRENGFSFLIRFCYLNLFLHFQLLTQC